MNKALLEYKMKEKGKKIGDRNDLVLIFFFHEFQPPHAFCAISIEWYLQLNFNLVSTEVEKRGIRAIRIPRWYVLGYSVWSVTVKRQPPSGMFSAAI